MNISVLYEDADCRDFADEMYEQATIAFGVAPRRMTVGVDITREELEEVLLIDLRRTELPLLVDPTTDEIFEEFV